jgi:hypothetical protein
VRAGRLESEASRESREQASTMQVLNTHRTRVLLFVLPCKVVPLRAFPCALHSATPRGTSHSSSTSDAQDDLYSGYDDANSPLSGVSSPVQPVQAAGPTGRMGTPSRTGTGRVGTAGRLRSAVPRGPTGYAPGTARKPGTALHMGTAALGDDGARPMTAVKAAGYVGATKPASRGASRGDARGPSDAERCKKMEAEVHELIEAAAILMHDKKGQEGILLQSRDKHDGRQTALPCHANRLCRS